MSKWHLPTSNQTYSNICIICYPRYKPSSTCCFQNNIRRSMSIHSGMREAWKINMTSFKTVSLVWMTYEILCSNLNIYICPLDRLPKAIYIFMTHFYYLKDHYDDLLDTSFCSSALPPLKHSKCSFLLNGKVQDSVRTNTSTALDTYPIFSEPFARTKAHPAFWKQKTMPDFKMFNHASS